MQKLEKQSLKVYVSLIAIAALIFGFSVYTFLPANQASSAPLGFFNTFNSVATSGHMLVGIIRTPTPKATKVLGTTTNRVYALITNDGGNKVFLNLGDDNTKLRVGQGIPLAPNGGSYEINQENLFTGAILAISENSTTSVTVIEAK